ASVSKAVIIADHDTPRASASREISRASSSAIRIPRARVMIRLLVHNVRTHLEGSRASVVSQAGCDPQLWGRERMLSCKGAHCPQDSILMGGHRDVASPLR